MEEPRKSAEQYLAEPYSIVLVPDKEAGGYTAMISEFPGCIAEGESAEDAIANVREAAVDWIQAAHLQGQDIPEPSAKKAAFSGRVALRLPRSLHRKAVEAAAAESTSLNQFLVSAVAEKIGRVDVEQAVRKIFDDVSRSVYRTGYQTWSDLLSASSFQPSGSQQSAIHLSGSFGFTGNMWGSYAPITCKARLVTSAPPLGSFWDESIYLPHKDALTVIRVKAAEGSEASTDVENPAA